MGAGFKWPWAKNKGGRPVLTEDAKVDRAKDRMLEKLIEMQEQSRKDTVRLADALALSLDRVVEARFDRPRAIPSPRAEVSEKSPLESLNFGDEGDDTPFLEAMRPQ